MSQSDTEESWRAAWSSPLRVAIILFAVPVALLLLWVARSIVVFTFLGLLVAVSIAPAVDWLQRFRIPRAAGAAAVVLTLLALLAGVATMFAPVLRAQGSELRQRIPEAVDQVDDALARRHLVQGTSLPLLLSQQLGKVRPWLFPIFSTTLSVLAGIILMIFLAIFVAADPPTYVQGALLLMPRRHRARATSVLQKIGHALRAWVLARSAAMATIGIVVTVAMALLGVRAFVALGVIAAIFELVPVFGPILGAIPAIVLAFADSPQKALLVAITFLVIQQLEGNVLIPMLLQKAVEVPPALSLLGVALMATFLGVLGVLIAEPLVAATLVTVRMLREDYQHPRAEGG